MLPTFFLLPLCYHFFFFYSTPLATKMFSFTFMFPPVLVWLGFGSCLTGLRIGLFVYLLADWSAALFGSI